MSMQVGQLVRQLRQQSGLSLRQLALEAGTSAAALSNYERGLTEPRLSTRERVVAATGAELVLHVRYIERAGSPADVARAKELRDAFTVPGASSVENEWSAPAAALVE